jgi:hypothetical protein
VLLAFVGSLSGNAQSTIRYSGPQHIIIPLDRTAALDVDDDGLADFGFGAELLTTFDTSEAFLICSVHAGAGRQFLASGQYAFFQPIGAVVAEARGLTGEWQDDAGLTVTKLGSSTWSGSLGQLGNGYLGIRLSAADGWHYGWIHVRLPLPVDFVSGAGGFTPIVLDSAYETRPGTPILAGDVGSGSDSVQFVVDFRNPDGTPRGLGQYRSTGLFILTGNTFRYEIYLAGAFSLADLRGPASQQSRARPVSSLANPVFYTLPPSIPFGMPLQFSFFFGELTLSHPQLIQLERGAYYFSVDGGKVVGRLFPALPDGTKD